MVEVKDYYKTFGIDIVAVDFDKGGPTAASLRAVQMSSRKFSTHVSVVERAIQQIKEKMRSIITLLPYDIPSKILLHITIAATMSINTVSRKANDGLSAFSILHQKTQDYKAQFALAPGEYVEVHTISNNDVARPRTVSAVALHPDPDNLNEWHFYSLDTGETFIRHYNDAYPLPISSQVVDRINYLASKDPVVADPSVNER